jgi:hypothetical protein
MAFIRIGRAAQAARPVLERHDGDIVELIHEVSLMRQLRSMSRSVSSLQAEARPSAR